MGGLGWGSRQENRQQLWNGTRSFPEASRTRCWVGWSLASQLRGANTLQGEGLCRWYSHFSAQCRCHPTGPRLSKSYCLSMTQCVVFAHITIFKWVLVFVCFFFLSNYAVLQKTQFQFQDSQKRNCSSSTSVGVSAEVQETCRNTPVEETAITSTRATSPSSSQS